MLWSARKSVGQWSQRWTKQRVTIPSLYLSIYILPLFQTIFRSNNYPLFNLLFIRLNFQHLLLLLRIAEREYQTGRDVRTSPKRKPSLVDPQPLDSLLEKITTGQLSPNLQEAEDIATILEAYSLREDRKKKILVIEGLIGLANRTRSEEGWKRSKVADALGHCTKNPAKHPEVNSILIELLQNEKDDIFQGNYREIGIVITITAAC